VVKKEEVVQAEMAQLKQETMQRELLSKAAGPVAGQLAGQLPAMAMAGQASQTPQGQAEQDDLGAPPVAADLPPQQ
jgi:hypothetical protein